MQELTQVEPPHHSPELLRMKVLSEKYQDVLGPIRITQVGKSGYIIERGNHKPAAGKNWVMFDYDDTVVATTEVKQKRKKLYADYIQNSLHLKIEDDFVDKILESTDNFSRWEDSPGSGIIYHANIHMSALTWLTEELQKASKDPSFDQKKIIDEKISQLSHIAKQRNDPQTEKRNDDPFYFDDDHKIILKDKRPWNADIEEIFMKSMINPPQYDETIAATKEITDPKDPVHRMNVGMFSFGDPYYQFLKICELIKQRPDLPLSQLWISSVAKGDFIKEAVLSKATQNTWMATDSPSNWEGSEEDAIIYGWGYPLAKNPPHTFILFDDSVKEAESVNSANTFLKEHTGAQFVVVRSIRSGTKEEKKTMKIQTPFGSIDFRTKTLLPKNIAGILKFNGYSSRKKLVPPDDKILISMKEELVKYYDFDPDLL